MYLHTLPAFKCPFCVNQNGQIHADLEAVRGYKGSYEIHVDTDLEQRVLRFGPPGRENAPCGHVIDFCLEIDLDEVPSEDASSKNVSLGMRYDHPSISESNAHFLRHLELLNITPHAPFFDLRSQYHVYEIRTRYKAVVGASSAPHAKIKISGWVAVTKDPQQFISELRLLDEAYDYAHAQREKSRTKSHLQSPLKQPNGE